MKDHAMHVMEQLEIPEDKIAAFFNEIPMASHNQRGRGFLCVETDGDIIVPLKKIVTVLKESMSAKIYELLKRGDESYVVMEAHKKRQIRRRLRSGDGTQSSIHVRRPPGGHAHHDPADQ